MEAKPKTVREYTREDGSSPFAEWIFALRDKVGKVVILKRLNMVAKGSLGLWRPAGEGVMESKIDIGPGYRVYYGTHGDEVIILAAGDKNSQDADIKIAKQRWREWREADA